MKTQTIFKANIKQQWKCWKEYNKKFKENKKIKAE